MNLLYWLKGKPGYCSKCGALLEEVKEPHDYSPKTGKPQKIRTTIKCPEWRTVCIGRYLVDGSEAWKSNGHDFYTWG